MLINSSTQKISAAVKMKSHSSIISEAKENDDHVDVSLNTGIRQKAGDYY